MKHTSGNKLNRLWQRGILPALAKKLEVTKVLKTQEQVEANTNPDNVASAVVVGEVINNLGGCQFAQEGNDFYIVGADSVRKKLGSGNYRITVQANAGIDGASTGAQNTAYFDIIDGIPSTPKSISSNQDWSKRVTCSIPQIVSVQEIN